MRKLFQILGGFIAKSRQLRTRRFKPSLELIERRDTPSAFFWYAETVGDWEDGNNWGGTPGVMGDYPGWNGTAVTTDDTAQFAGPTSAARMRNAHELASIELTANFTGTLRLDAALTLNNGGTMANGTIIQRPAGDTTNGTITLTFGEFTWSGGNINVSSTMNTTPSTLTVVGPSTLTLTVTTGVGFGSDLYIREGTVILGNRGTLGVRNRPTFTNEGGEIRVTSFGNITYEGDKIPIANNGIISKIAGGSSYDIGMPVTNQEGASIIAQDGELRFSAADPATGYSIDQRSTILLDGGNLRADSGIEQSTGVIEARRSGTITGRVDVGAGDVIIGTMTSPGAILQISGNFKLEGGKIQYWYDTVGHVGGLLRAFGGSITIVEDFTEIVVAFHGGGELPANYRIMVATGGILGVAGIIPPGYRSDIVGGVIGDEYWLRLVQ